MKTVSVALVLCLNVGVDPPDIIKTQPCARLECWIGNFNFQFYIDNMLPDQINIQSFTERTEVKKNKNINNEEELLGN